MIFRQTGLKSFHAQSSAAKAQSIVDDLQRLGSGVLVSDAGTPGISDPGFILIQKAIEKGIEIIPVPGPSALITLLSASGFPIDKFYYGGFFTA